MCSADSGVTKTLTIQVTSNVVIEPVAKIIKNHPLGVIIITCQTIMLIIIGHIVTTLPETQNLFTADRNPRYTRGYNESRAKFP